MKNLIFINGTMGVGKTTTSRELQKESIINKVISHMNSSNYKLYKFSLVCDQESLISRLLKDINNGIRCNDIINKSILRLRKYISMDTKKIDVSNISAKEAAKRIYNTL